jgi:hypothetical protein
MHKGWYSHIIYFDNHILYYLGMEGKGRVGITKKMHELGAQKLTNKSLDHC